MQRIVRALCGAFLTLAASAAAGFDLAALAPCYTRDYSAAHLDAHPVQNVATLALSLRPDAGFAIARLTGTDRTGRPGHLSFMCSETAPGQFDDGCATAEGDSQIWITLDETGDVTLRTRNVFLSDIGQGIDYLDDVEGHYRFYLEEGPHSYAPNTGPFYSFRLGAAAARNCNETG